MKAIVQDVNIRGCEAKTNAKGEGYLIVRFEDITGKPEEVIDKNMTRQNYYKRDTVGDLIIDIQIGKWTNIRVVDFKIKGE